MGSSGDTWRLNVKISNSLSIIHVIPQDGIGGVEVAAKSVIDNNAECVKIKVMVIAGKAIKKNNGITEAFFLSQNNPLAHLYSIFKILKFNPDVMICSLWRSVPVCLFVKTLKPRTRMVFFLHVDRYVHILDRILTWLGIRAADEIWADSAETLRARSIPVGKPAKVVSFVTERKAAARNDPIIAPKFVCWARIVPQKGIDQAIRLIGLMVERGINAQFDIYGPDGGVQRSLEQQIEKSGLNQNIRFLGPIDPEKLSEIAGRSSFFLQLSRFEGLGMAVVEAMQLGLVPIATPAGQIAHYVDATTGIRVDTADLSATADRIAALLDDPEGYVRLRNAAMAYWRAAPLYADHVVAYARSLAERR